jgi:hypothetical protein
MLEEPFFFEAEFLAPYAQRYRPRYSSALPFPHVVIDGFLPVAVAERIVRDYPGPSFPFFKQSDTTYQPGKLGKLQESKFRGLSPFIRHLLNEFNARAFLDFLEELTGIEGLIGDPHFRGGALQQILPRGKLAIHADFNFDKRRNLDRRINALIYFNKDWKDEYGGHLELWAKDMSRCVSRIAPLFNRCVIFNTTSTSYHGHPDPLNCPEGITRKAIALYYYTNGRPEEEKRAPHGTLWQVRPDEAPPTS